MDNKVRIRTVAESDIYLIHSLVRDLAVYEHLEHIFALTESDIKTAIFNSSSKVEVLIGELDGEAVGFALFYHNYSTFLGRKGLFLEDLFVRPSARGHGVGKALLRALAKVAVERDCARLEWFVLDWNEPSIAFYNSLGAAPMDGWKIFRMSSDNIAKLANMQEAT